MIGSTGSKDQICCNSLSYSFQPFYKLQHYKLQHNCPAQQLEDDELADALVLYILRVLESSIAITQCTLYIDTEKSFRTFS